MAIPSEKTDRPSAEQMLKAFCNLTLYFLPEIQSEWHPPGQDLDDAERRE